MTLILILVFASFIQSSLLSVQLILMALLARSFIVTDRLNFGLAFGLGLLLSLLTGGKLGVLSIVYLLGVILIYFIKERSVGSHWAILLPITIFMLMLDAGVKSLIFGASLDIRSTLLQTVLVLPLYFITILWEERFVIKKEIRLKVGR